MQLITVGIGFNSLRAYHLERKHYELSDSIGSDVLSERIDSECYACNNLHGILCDRHSAFGGNDPHSWWCGLVIQLRNSPCCWFMKEIGYCDSCRHSRRVNDTLGTMECRRYPPQSSENFKHAFYFPSVDKHTWCGEFEQKRKIGEEPNAKVSS